ncbi:G-protein-signaling modulator 2 [Trichinella spiralis]|uniref:G-protein-signaling modulator 2 n=1 Tax=Trichinella spiralis TaxID=6334 RepID=A0A0V1BBY5_TRISP|nr:G-protein-signaling modulator 2 [Trichinella spiralis]
MMSLPENFLDGSFPVEFVLVVIKNGNSIKIKQVQLYFAWCSNQHNATGSLAVRTLSKMNDSLTRNANKQRNKNLYCVLNCKLRSTRKFEIKQWELCCIIPIGKHAENKFSSQFFLFSVLESATLTKFGARFYEPFGSAERANCSVQCACFVFCLLKIVRCSMGNIFVLRFTMIIFAIRLGERTTIEQQAVGATIMVEADILRENDMDSLKLALEGQQRCQRGDMLGGVWYLEAALGAGTDDLKTLSAVYSQLGNAYFVLQQYGKALEYHRHDHTLARAVGDRRSEANASGNLCNTLKALGKYDEASLCGKRHLELARSLQDKTGEVRACYNLGGVYYSKARHLNRPQSADLSEYAGQVRQLCLQSIEYYEMNLKLTQEMGDRVGEGRACGNIGLAYHLLGDFKTAVQFHNERLQIAKEFGDKRAMRRAYSNLGNASVFLGELEPAIQNALAVARELKDIAAEGQAFYSLGNCFTLLRDYRQAVDYHLRHLGIARLLSDKVGQARACWSLSNAFIQLEESEKSLYFTLLHYDLSKEIGDKNGEMVAELNLVDLSQLMGSGCHPDSSMDPVPVKFDDEIVASVLEKAKNAYRTSCANSGGNSAAASSASRPNLPLAHSFDAPMVHMPNNLSTKSLSDSLDQEAFFDYVSRAQSKRMDDQRCDPDKATSKNSVTAHRQAITDVQAVFLPVDAAATQCCWHEAGYPRPSKQSARSWLKRISKTCGRKSRKYIPVKEDVAQASSSTSSLTEHHESDDLVDLIIGMQSRRMDDQRASLPFLPGLQNSAALAISAEAAFMLRAGSASELHPNVDASTSTTSGKTTPDAGLQQRIQVGQEEHGNAEEEMHHLDEFFDILIRCQSTRIEEQRSEFPAERALTVPDEDFFELVLKLQARRFEEQRANLKTPVHIEQMKTAISRTSLSAVVQDYIIIRHLSKGEKLLLLLLVTMHSDEVHHNICLQFLSQSFYICFTYSERSNFTISFHFLHNNNVYDSSKFDFSCLTIYNMRFAVNYHILSEDLSKSSSRLRYNNNDNNNNNNNHWFAYLCVCVYFYVYSTCKSIQSRPIAADVCLSPPKANAAPASANRAARCLVGKSCGRRAAAVLLCRPSRIVIIHSSIRSSYWLAWRWPCIHFLSITNNNQRITRFQQSTTSGTCIDPIVLFFVWSNSDLCVIVVLFYCTPTQSSQIIWQFSFYHQSSSDAT